MSFNPSNIVNVIIEIAKGSHIKYEYDKQNGLLVCDRILHAPMKYPFNYGFIPETLSEDGDPIDVVVLMDDSLVPGSSLHCRVIGYLDTEDDAGNDPKLIVCPIEKIDPTMADVQDMSDISDSFLLKRIRYFFQHYKDLENKSVRIGEYGCRNEATFIVNDGFRRYRERTYVQKNKITNYFPRLQK